jgi:eukaryotic-like serine/threonine-protein kinase
MDAVNEQAEEIFCAALEISEPGRRAAFLEERCAEDPRLRTAVEHMLAMQNQVERFFGSSAPVPAEMISGAGANVPLSASAELEAGKQVGPYKLLERLGEGGCGVVYLAEQVVPVHRQVALKLIKLGMDTKSVIARFEAERQALAMMDHPNIAHVLDAGATESGRPYFVMELVRGIRITRYCDQERLTTRQRLDLFIHVCHAIQHAHQKGVIHRDIKPSNILITMVDGEPVPKVIDFGIAKATGGQLLGGNTVFTACDQFVGTPAYMSPEQAALSGLDVDTRSDIYSLGVLLYELLTGKTPFAQDELMQSGLDEMRRTLREQDPHRPSTKLDELRAEELTQTAMQRHVEPRRLKLLLTGDLDWIVMKALEKDRDRRYQTVNGLAMDVYRYLNNELVMARPPSWSYRFHKLVRRNRTTFTAGAAVFLALIAGFGTSTWLFFRERDARREQSELRQEADARAKIAQAAVVLSRGRSAEADQLVDKLQIPVAEPSLEAAGVFRSLGDWNVLQGRWRPAADRFLKLLQANQVDKTDMTDAATRDLLRAAPSLLAAGDFAGYQNVVQQTITRFAGTTNSVAAEQIIKISVMTTLDRRTAETLAPLAVIVEQSLSEEAVSKEVYMAAWRMFALSLFEYRRGHDDRAIFWARRSLDSKDGTPTRVAMSHLVLALAFEAQRQPDSAQAELAMGRKLVEAKLPDQLRKISDLGGDTAGFWHDWVMAYFLLKEADGATPLRGR